MEKKRLIEKDPELQKDDLIVITGAGGFIGGNLALYFKKKGFSHPGCGQETALRMVSQGAGR
jgi:NADP-dependent 3-hydroxy acid dehydrogenase YdfG